MRTIKYKWSSSNGRVGSNQDGEGEIEVGDDATPEEIEESVEREVREEVFNYFDWGFEIIE